MLPNKTEILVNNNIQTICYILRYECKLNIFVQETLILETHNVSLLSFELS